MSNISASAYPEKFLNLLEKKDRCKGALPWPFPGTFCPGRFDGFMCWPHGRAHSLVEAPCPPGIPYGEDFFQTYRKLRCTRNYIHINLMLSFMLRYVVNIVTRATGLPYVDTLSYNDNDTFPENMTILKKYFHQYCDPSGNIGTRVVGTNLGAFMAILYCFRNSEVQTEVKIFGRKKKMKSTAAAFKTCSLTRSPITRMSASLTNDCSFRTFLGKKSPKSDHCQDMVEGFIKQSNIESKGRDLNFSISTKPLL
ncbi:unnamed protein product [Clavelina lepadiformis]|uniref:G-protein coupled receptors family 2 profile 1 domain-containing protein n=1 Tax=Clavelina lepadiformis TaxID=159417 RepID=A0ABP0FV21_CLALP